MNIGIDFDNTLVAYDRLFYQLACEANLIPTDLEPTKLAVRGYLRGIDREDAWTELQGLAYGARLGDADVYSGVEMVLCALKAAGYTLTVISHKTAYPFKGPRVQLQEKARDWLRDRAWLDASDAYFKEAYFLPTRAEKINKIQELGCALFIDDLVEVLRDKDFPSGTSKLLFDPTGKQKLQPDERCMSAWSMAAFEGIL